MAKLHLLKFSNKCRIYSMDKRAQQIRVVGSCMGFYMQMLRPLEIAEAFNQAIAKEVGTVVLGRDHHDVSGTDSPYRETSN
jgi:urocanate hydratase